jgi:glucose-1-phosphate cytidylyltransferase
MKIVILAGGLGTRLSEETVTIPKPLVEIGSKPILWHIMKIFSYYGHNEFIICCGYKGYLIKEYFANYFLHQSDVTFNLKDNSFSIHDNSSEPWNVTLVDTGENTMTGGRLKRVKKFIKNEENFGFTYGDGLSDVNIASLLKLHQNHGKQATLTVVRPPGRYGAVKLGSNNKVLNFQEKPDGDNSWINGGFFILKPNVLDLIKDDGDAWEINPLNNLTKNNQLYAYKHQGFWQPMDTLREKILLNELWNKNIAPWKIWK